MRVPDALANAEVRTSADEPRPMHELWRDRPALILWVRHFG
jgi:hypothetical protein